MSSTTRALSRVLTEGLLVKTGTLFAALPIAALAFAVAPLSSASAASPTTYTATLAPLNHATGSGTVSLMLNGDVATITEHFSGLAATFSGAPYPHVQHIHINGQGQCPTAAADTSGDGVVSTTEGQPAYGPIGTTLSTSGDTSPAAATDLKVAPSGGSFDYSRTITLSADSAANVRAGKAVVVVHGLDPATLSAQAQGESSELVPSLPLAATSPALCGVLVAAQMTVTPAGGAATGGGSTSGLQNTELLAVGGGLVLLAGVGVIAARRRTDES